MAYYGWGITARLDDITIERYGQWFTLQAFNSVKIHGRMLIKLLTLFRPYKSNIAFEAFQFGAFNG
jgi:hypothetical protein